MLRIYEEEKEIGSAASAILVPEKAVDEAGYIVTMTDTNDASSKHEFHAMAQMAYFQFQDDELKIGSVSGTICVDSGGRREHIDSGLVLYRDSEGGFHALVHDGLNTKKLLEAAYRFCTRWVRLDI